MYRPHSSSVLPFIPLLLGAIFSLVLNACVTSQATNPMNPEPPAPIQLSTEKVEMNTHLDNLSFDKQTACKGLDSQLYSITQSLDPLNEAKQKGLKVMNGKVQVIFILSDSDAAFLLDYGVELGSQVADQVQAYAPIERLCELSNLEKVLAIQSPARVNLP